MPSRVSTLLSCVRVLDCDSGHELPHSCSQEIERSSLCYLPNHAERHFNECLTRFLIAIHHDWSNNEIGAKLYRHRLFQLELLVHKVLIVVYKERGETCSKLIAFQTTHKIQVDFLLLSFNQFHYLSIGALSRTLILFLCRDFVFLTVIPVHLRLWPIHDFAIGSEPASFRRVFS